MKIGLIAGGGELPKHVLQAATEDGLETTIIGLQGYAKPEDYKGQYFFKVAEFGKIVKRLKKTGCTHLCFAGTVERPNFKSLKPDLKGMLHMPGAMKAAKEGDDALLRYLLSLFEKEGFEIVAPQTLCQSLLLPEGILGTVKILDAQSEDTRKACEVASQIGALDIGQAAVVCRGVVLAVEAQEGTDAMLGRILSLPKTIRGTLDNRSGVLAKMVKPGQDIRVDLPTIGPLTVENASKAGLAGIVGEGGRAFIIEREKTIQMANEAGLFIAGLPPSRP